MTRPMIAQRGDIGVRPLWRCAGRRTGQRAGARLRGRAMATRPFSGEAHPDCRIVHLRYVSGAREVRLRVDPGGARSPKWRSPKIRSGLALQGSALNPALSQLRADFPGLALEGPQYSCPGKRCFRALFFPLAGGRKGGERPCLSGGGVVASSLAARSLALLWGSEIVGSYKTATGLQKRQERLFCSLYWRAHPLPFEPCVWI